MSLEIRTITTPFMFRITVNCYLVRSNDDFILIDTARAGKRQVIEKELEKAGCKPGNLKLIILTHGDFDHCGNAAYFGKKFQAQITMHEADRGMVEQGDMFWNRKSPNFIIKFVMRLLFRLSKADRFKPDFFVKEDDNLSEYGFAAKVIEIPGHSKGSIALLTTDGDLFCGDLLANVDKPDVWSIIDDHQAASASVKKLKGVEINTVYPGHGRPFPMQLFLKDYEATTSEDADLTAP